MISKISGYALLVAAALLTLTNQAHSAGSLVQSNLISHGQVVTAVWDSETSLQWLTPAATVRQAASSVLSGFGEWVPSGFRYATPSEFLALLDHAGLAAGAGANFQQLSWSQSDDIGRMQWLLDAIGSTYVNNPPSQRDLFGQKSTYGILSEVSSTAGVTSPSFSLAYFSASQSGAFATMGGQWSVLASDSLVGSFLVRSVSAVPEPTESLLMLTGLFAVVCIRRRQTLKKG
jgi:hypothetical protein